MALSIHQKVVICLAIVMGVVFAAEAAVTCNMVAGALKGCVPYVTDKGAIGSCCGGLTSLYRQAVTTSDRQMACNCLKSLAKAVPGINLGKAAGLPKQCKINIPYQISPNTDCSKVK